MEFETIGLAPRLTAQLAKLGITKATPIQAQAIPYALDGRDVMGLAQTGTGKTMAFGLPIIHTMSKLGVKSAPKAAHGLILAPTRELARQIFEALSELTRGSHIKTALVVGGGSIYKQVERMRRGTDLLIATPGRLIDLIERDAVNLNETRFLVLDEADQMLDMGFIHSLRRIAPLLSPDPQTMLFSATMSRQMAELAEAYLSDYVRVEVARPGLAADKIRQSIHFVQRNDKFGLLTKLLQNNGTRSLVFARTKHGAERLMKQLEKSGFVTGSIHGNKSQGQRDRAIKEFKAGQIDVLVATDVAARGIDIDRIKHVYNYDLPNVAENYVHRIGRTARAGAEGTAIAFCAPDEVKELREIEKLLGGSIAVAGGSPWQVNSNDAKKGARGKQNEKPQAANRNQRRRPRRKTGMKRAA